MEAKLSYRGRIVTDTDIAFIRQLIAENPAASRWRLSKKLCQAWNWTQPNGTLRDMLCRSLMLQLHRAGHIELPPVRRVIRNYLAARSAERKKPAPWLVDTTPLYTTLAEVRPLEFRQVRRTGEEPLFNHLIDRYHYLGYTQPVGEHLKYLVYALGRPIACLAWSSAPRHLGPRDRFIGWSPEARRNNIRFIAYNTRFLVLPFVQVPRLASHILGRMARILPFDWEQIYGHPIYFLETFVDPRLFPGTSYRAANWILLGSTAGRGKDDQHHKPNRPIKHVLGYPLCKDFRRLMGKGDGSTQSDLPARRGKGSTHEPWRDGGWGRSTEEARGIPGGKPPAAASPGSPLSRLQENGGADRGGRREDSVRAVARERNVHPLQHECCEELFL